MDTLNRVEAEEARRQKGEIRRVGGSYQVDSLPLPSRRGAAAGMRSADGFAG